MKDNKVIKATEKIKQAQMKILRDKKQRQEDKLILGDNMPKDKKLKVKVKP